MDMELYNALQRLGRDNSHAKMVAYCTDFALNGSVCSWVFIGDACDALGNIKLAQLADVEESLDAWYRDQRLMVRAADALNTSKVQP